MPWTDRSENKYQDHHWRSDAYTPPTEHHFALFVATEGFWAPLETYTAGDTILPLTPSGGNGRMYRCTQSGTSAASEPTFPEIAGNTVADGSVIWQEMTPDFQSESAFLTEVSNVGTGYDRVVIARGNANFLGTHGTTTGPSSGTGGNIRNAVLIEFGTPVLDWGLVAHWGAYDQLNDLTWYAPLSIPRLVLNGSTPPAFPFGSLSITVNTKTAIV